MATFEVRFRGEDETQLLAWKPLDGTLYRCTAMEARQRYGELVDRGVAQIPVDGTVPFVVAIVQLDFKVREGIEIARPDTVLWQYCEEGAVLEGPWAQSKAA